MFRLAKIILMASHCALVAAQSRIESIVRRYDVPADPCASQLAECDRIPACAPCFGQDFQPPVIDLYMLESCHNMMQAYDDVIIQNDQCERGTRAVNNVLKCAAAHYFQVAYDGLVPSDVCGVDVPGDAPTPAPTTASTTEDGTSATASPTAAPTESVTMAPSAPTLSRYF